MNYDAHLLTLSLTANLYRQFLLVPISALSPTYQSALANRLVL